MKDVEYAYQVAYIKTLENKMLTRQDIDELIGASEDRSEKILAEHGYRGENLFAMLKNELERAYTAVLECLDDEKAVDILLLENDFHNLKTVLKTTVSGQSWQGMSLEPTKTEPSVIEACIKSGDYSELPEYIRDIAQNAYRLLRHTMDAQQTEIYLDNAYLAVFLDRARATKDSFIIGWAELYCTLARLKALWRFIKMGKTQEFIQAALEEGPLAESIDEVTEIIKKEFPDADITSLTSFECWCDNRLASHIKAAKSESFSLRPIIAFLIGKRYEVQNVRIIMSAKEHGVPAENVRERLRYGYV